jgi:hypothetical protein
MNCHPLFWLSFALLIAVALGQGCTWTDPASGKKYDLTPLKVSKNELLKIWRIAIVFKYFGKNLQFFCNILNSHII